MIKLTTVGSIDESDSFTYAAADDAGAIRVGGQWEVESLPDAVLAELAALVKLYGTADITVHIEYSRA